MPASAVPGSAPRYSVQYMHCFQTHYAKKVKKNCIKDESGTKFMEKHKSCTTDVCKFPSENFKTEYGWQELASFKKDSAAGKMVELCPLEMIDLLLENNTENQSRQESFVQYSFSQFQKYAEEREKANQNNLQEILNSTTIKFTEAVEEMKKTMSSTSTGTESKGPETLNNSILKPDTADTTSAFEVLNSLCKPKTETVTLLDEGLFETDILNNSMEFTNSTTRFNLFDYVQNRSDRL